MRVLKNDMGGNCSLFVLVWVSDNFFFKHNPVVSGRNRSLPRGPHGKQPQGRHATGTATGTAWTGAIAWGCATGTTRTGAVACRRYVALLLPSDMPSRGRFVSVLPLSCYCEHCGTRAYFPGGMWAYRLLVVWFLPWRLEAKRMWHVREGQVAGHRVKGAVSTWCGMVCIAARDWKP
jgi:hypothetical protein